MKYQWHENGHTLFTPCRVSLCWGCPSISSSHPTFLHPRGSGRLRWCWAVIYLSLLYLGKEEGRVQEHKGDLRDFSLPSSCSRALLTHQPISFFLKSLGAIYLSTQPGHNCWDRISLIHLSQAISVHLNFHNKLGRYWKLGCLSYPSKAISELLFV